jgi:hypothetical protein
MEISLPIEIITLEEESYHLLIEAKANNMRLNLIIDTGASKTIFDTNTCNNEAGDIKAFEEQTTSGINAMIEACYQGSFSTFSLGELALNNFNCTLMDLSHVNKVYAAYFNKSIHGLLGSDFLLKHNAIINYRTRLLTLTIN